MVRADVGEQHAGVRAWRGGERLHQLAPLRAAQVDRDRALALVQAAPVQAAPARHARHAGVVDAAADHVDADHVGAVLRQRQAGQRSGDEGGTLDDAQAVQERVGHGVKKAVVWIVQMLDRPGPRWERPNERRRAWTTP
jgi:hypothetical protein